MGIVDLKALLGAAIRAERSSLHISQEELAYRSGLHRTYVSDLERGARNPSLESVEKLAEALDLSVSALFARTGQSEVKPSLVDILLVEDNPHDVELTKHAFAKARITNPLRVAHDGAEALDIIFRKGSYAEQAGWRRPQVVLLDLNLPKKSGLEVLREIKANEATRDIRVIVLTASSRDHDIKECRRLGVASYIVKPVNFQTFSEITAQLRLGWTLVRPHANSS